MECGIAPPSGLEEGDCSCELWKLGMWDMRVLGPLVWSVRRCLGLLGAFEMDGQDDGAP